MTGDASFRPDRRAFLKGAVSAGALLCLGAQEVLSSERAGAVAPPAAFDYRFRTVSTRHVPELRAWLRRLDRERQLATHPVYRRYIGGFQYAPPKSLPGARSLVVLAVRQRLCAVTFHLDGRPHDVLIPTGYASQSYSMRDIIGRVTHEVIGGRGRLERARLPLKTLAVHSGLAQYGRNNVTFVEEYGSFHELHGFWTDRVLEDQWRPLRLMRLCKGCSICREACPTGAFSQGRFVIDAGRCLTLHNELDDPYPAWIPPAAHHTLVGCLRCQHACPANRDFVGDVDRIADIPEEETRFILSGRSDPGKERTITARIPRFQAGYAYIARAARLALANGPRY